MQKTPAEYRAQLAADEARRAAHRARQLDFDRSLLVFFDTDDRDQAARRRLIRRPRAGWSRTLPVWDLLAALPAYGQVSGPMAAESAGLDRIVRAWALAPVEAQALGLGPDLTGHPVGFGLRGALHAGRCICHDCPVVFWEFALWPLSPEGIRLPAVSIFQQRRALTSDPWQRLFSASELFQAAWQQLRTRIGVHVAPDEEPARSQLAALGWVDDDAAETEPLCSAPVTP